MKENQQREETKKASLPLVSHRLHSTLLCLAQVLCSLELFKCISNSSDSVLLPDR